MGPIADAIGPDHVSARHDVMGVLATAGYSLVELLFAVSLFTILSGVAIPQLHAAVDDYRAAGAARYVAALVQRTRMEAISRSAHVALQFASTASGYSYATYVDGNGDGVLTKDIKKGTDPL